MEKKKKIFSDISVVGSDIASGDSGSGGLGDTETGSGDDVEGSGKEGSGSGLVPHISDDEDLYKKNNKRPHKPKKPVVKDDVPFDFGPEYNTNNRVTTHRPGWENTKQPRSDGGNSANYLSISISCLTSVIVLTWVVLWVVILS